MNLNPNEAQDRARALLTVIETAYGIRIVNFEAVIKAITEKTRDEQQILTICTALNTWIATNAGLSPDVEIPPDVINGLLERVMRLKSGDKS
jgi:mannose/fructose/N-acetylgalactosamine-specific phosphotransferase system component IIB